MSLDFSFTPEQEAFRAHVREFAQREIAPYVKEWDQVEQLRRITLFQKWARPG